MTTSPIIVLFGKDLRLADHPALHTATKTGAPLVLLYVLDDTSPGHWKMGAAIRWWLHESLAKLQESLAKKRQALILRKGPLEKTVQQVVKETGASKVYFNRRYDPWFKEFKEIETETFNGSLLIEPWDVSTKSGDPFRVFTPFWNKSLEILEPRKPLPAPELPPAKIKLKSDLLESWKLQKKGLNFRDFWQPGEQAAKKQLKNFLSDVIGEYHNLRDRPDLEGTSRLSPYLQMGEISPHQVWDEITQRGEGPSVYKSELGWREFSYHLLYHFPQITDQNFNTKFDPFPWEENPNALEKWKNGMTGFPIVDAGMRELKETGWMHNRVRMIAASFLTKDLRIHWLEGAKWFWERLVDADIANNSASWQWVAGCGADAAPYFRIFNPTLQAYKFDPEGDYVRLFIPELAHIKDKTVHEPGMFGKDYPDPMVDHKAERNRSLELFKTL